MNIIRAHALRKPKRTTLRLSGKRLLHSLLPVDRPVFLSDYRQLMILYNQREVFLFEAGQGYFQIVMLTVLHDIGRGSGVAGHPGLIKRIASQEAFAVDEVIRPVTNPM